MGGQEAVIASPATATAAAPVAVAPTLLAPGFRFHPTDEELVRYYLRRKACGKPFRFPAVTEIDVYKSEPWELAEHSSLKTRDMEWYFFSPVDRKYGNGSRLNRATGKGYWKATGKDRAVRHQTQIIGMKKTLVFHSGRAPDGKRTNWVMHEYRLCDSELKNAGVIQDAFVLCRIFQKSGLGPPNGDRYAPFVEEEWNDDDASLFIPEDDAVANGDEARNIELDEDTGPLTIASPQPEGPRKPQPLPLMCKRERSEEEPPELSLSHNTKRSKQKDDPSSSQQHIPNGSEDSITTATAITTTTTTKIMTKNFANSSSSTIVEFPLLEPPIVDQDNKKGGEESLNFGSSNLEKSVPPGYLKFISNLENEILNVSMEKETLKIEVMRAQARINVLQTRVEVLAKENDDLRRAHHHHRNGV